MNTYIYIKSNLLIVSWTKALKSFNNNNLFFKNQWPNKF